MEGIKTGAEIKTDSKTPSRAEKVKPQIGMMVSSISNILRNSTNGDFRKECFKITNVKHRQDFDKALMVKFEDFLMCNHGINISEKTRRKCKLLRVIPILQTTMAKLKTRISSFFDRNRWMRIIIYILDNDINLF